MQDIGHPINAEMKELTGRLARLLNVSYQRIASTKLDAFLVKVMQNITKLVSADRSSLFLVTPNQEHLVSFILQKTDIPEIHLDLGDGLAGWAAENALAIQVADVYQTPWFEPTWDEKSGYKTRNMVCHPILNKAGESLGILQCLNREEGNFSEDDLEVLRVTARLASAAIEAVVTGENAENMVERAEQQLHLAG